MDFGSTFHAKTGVDTDCLENEEVDIDLGEDDLTELQRAVALMIEEGKKNGLTNDGAERLTFILDKYPVFVSGCKIAII